MSEGESAIGESEESGTWREFGVERELENEFTSSLEVYIRQGGFRAKKDTVALSFFYEGGGKLLGRLDNPEMMRLQAGVT